MMTLPTTVTSFRDYFNLTPDPEKAARLLGYGFSSQRLALPRTAHELPWALDLQKRLFRKQTRIALTSETARREMLIAPVISGLLENHNAQVRIEYEVQASPNLKGSVDYYLFSHEEFLVVEGKNEDMNRGASQLVAEMAALDQTTQSDSPLLYGALSIGTVWQFYVLHRPEKRFEQDVQLYLVPDSVPDLCAILVGILRAEPDLDVQR